MMLTFTGQLDKILDGSKTMTTRLDAKERKYQEAVRKFRAGEPVIAHMWWKNPRTRHPDCYKIGRVTVKQAGRKLGAYFDQEDATRDGFTTIREYKQELARLNEMPWYEVDRTTWTQIIWKKSGWLDGPHPRKVA